MDKRICAECRKRIKGESLMIVPPNYLTLLLGSTIQHFHPECYERRQEKEHVG